MKPFRLSENLVPIHEFRQNIARFLQEVEETRRPVVVTQRGKASAVLVSPEMLDELQEEKEIVRLILRGLRDQERGEVFEDEDVWSEVEEIFSRAENQSEAEVE